MSGRIMRLTAAIRKDLNGDLLSSYISSVLSVELPSRAYLLQATVEETLLNLLLRNYLHYNLYDQAEAFRSKAQREEVWRSHQQYTRYLFYLGRIRAVQLEYSEARDCLQQASRKAPATALGFRVAADKWLTLVRLLLGEVPDRQELVAPGLALPLRPYFELTQAVRTGDTQMFSQVAQTHAAVFKQDATLNLITRLHHNVLRTGLRRIR
ncbi:PCI domain-containing protein [Haematococcus lacustris]|uniref:PCI domain-containing protein n=1 Tax=Haematococcus lacustris TaxID=44745 RepID=A0A699YTN6_HAELA|nr:PCI domain-containing protein [Haematococcus lacustris]